MVSIIALHWGPGKNFYGTIMTHRGPGKNFYGIIITHRGLGKKFCGIITITIVTVEHNLEHNSPFGGSAKKHNARF